MFLVCERWVGGGDRLLHIDPKFFWPYQHFFLILAGLLNRGSLRAQSPMSAAGSQFHILFPTDSNSNWNWLTATDSSRLWQLVIFLFDVYLLPVGVCICHHHRIAVKVIFRCLRPDAPVSLFFRLFTQVHLLIDGSVEGQYITHGWLRINELKVDIIKTH